MKGDERMRVKLNAKEYGIEHFRFGTRYGMGYVGSSVFEEFLFTRKNRIELCECDENGKKTSSRWCSKKELKRILASGSIQCVLKHIED